MAELISEWRERTWPPELGQAVLLATAAVASSYCELNDDADQVRSDSLFS